MNVTVIPVPLDSARLGQAPLVTVQQGICAAAAAVADDTWANLRARPPRSDSLKCTSLLSQKLAEVRYTRARSDSMTTQADVDGAATEVMVPSVSVSISGTENASRESSTTYVADNVQQKDDLEDTTTDSDYEDTPLFLDLPEYSYNAPSDESYPLDALVDFCVSLMYTRWYTQPPLMRNPTHSPNSDQIIRTGTLLSHDQPQFVHYVRSLLLAAKPAPYAVQKATEYVCRLRKKVETPESRTWGSHYAVFAVALMVSCKVLDDTRHAIAKWAVATSIPEKVLRAMELEFASMLEWRLL